MRNDHIRLQNTPTPFATPAGFTDLFVEDGVLMVQTHDGASEVGASLGVILSALGINAYADLATANLALTVGKPFYNTALSSLDITTT